MTSKLVKVSISLLKNVKLHQARSDHFTLRHEPGLLFSTRIVTHSLIRLLDDAQSVHLSRRSLTLLLDLEACDSDSYLFIWITLSKPEDILLKDQVLRPEHLPLQVCSELLRLGDACLVLKLQEHEVRADRVLLRCHHVSHFTSLDNDLQMTIARLLVNRRH